LDMMSKKYQIDPSNEMIGALKTIPEIAYKII
jgi:DNA polymerase III subunit alpha